MKKSSSILMVVTLMITILSYSVCALSYNPNEFCDLEVAIKKTNASNVIKDGVISNGEYERLNVDTSEESTSLCLCYGQSEFYPDAVELLNSMEYYFSWDEVHGFNFAVKCKPVYNFQTLEEGTDNPPLDDFLLNTGFVFVADPDITRTKDSPRPFFYYAVGKRTDTGAYLEGHWDQFGYRGVYDPEAGVDYCISYQEDGYAILEWSVPFDCFTQDSSVGSEIYFTITATGGNETAAEIIRTGDTEAYNYAHAVSLGDWGWMCKQICGSSNHVVGIISGEMVSGSNSGSNGDETGNNGGGEVTNPAANETEIVTEIETDENGETHVVTKIVNNNNNNTSNNNTNGGKQTGDPMIIVAALSAVSACGIVIFKKKH